MNKNKENKMENKKMNDVINIEQKNKITDELILDYLKASNIHLDENQIKQFITISMLYGLNPFKREIYAVAYKDRKTGKTNLSIITGYETYLKRAELNPNFDGYETKINGSFSKKTIKDYGYEKQIISPDSDNLSCTCTVFRKDRNHHISSTVFFDEYVQKNPMWETKPRTMIEKVAIVSAFRKAFPNDFGGLPYIPDELPKEMGFNENEKMQDVIEVNDYNNAVKVEVKEEVKEEKKNAFIKKVNELSNDENKIMEALGLLGYETLEDVESNKRRLIYKKLKEQLELLDAEVLF